MEGSIRRTVLGINELLVSQNAFLLGHVRVRKQGAIDLDINIKRDAAQRIFLKIP
jgi:hypothetical protein